MGRSYFGDIHGRFWTMCQSSRDIENLCSVEPTTVYRWMKCGCTFNRTQLDNMIKHTNMIYCTNSYNSYTEHVEAVFGEKCYGIFRLYHKDNDKIYYDVSRDRHKHEIEQSLEQIEKQIDLSGVEFTLSEDPPIRILNRKIDSTLDQDTYTLIARYIFGQQVLRVFEYSNICSFDCEP